MRTHDNQQGWNNSLRHHSLQAKYTMGSGGSLSRPEANHPSPCRAVVKIAWSFTIIPPYAFKTNNLDIRRVHRMYIIRIERLFDEPNNILRTNLFAANTLLETEAKIDSAI